MTRCINQFRTFAAMWPEKKFKVKKFTNSCKGNLRRWKIGIGQNDFVTVTHFGQGMEQVRWQDDWNSFQTSHFFQCRKFLFFGGSVYLLVSNAMIFHLFTQPSHENYQNFQNSEFFKYKKVTFNFHSQKKVIFLLKNWILTKYRKLSNFEFLRQNSIIFLNLIF